MSILNLCVDSLETMDLLQSDSEESDDNEVSIARDRGTTAPPSVSSKSSKHGKKKRHDKKKTSRPASDGRRIGSSDKAKSSARLTRDGKKGKGERQRTKFNDSGRKQNLSDPHVGRKVTKGPGVSGSLITPTIHAFVDLESSDEDENENFKRKESKKKHKHSKSTGTKKLDLPVEVIHEQESKKRIKSPRTKSGRKKRDKSEKKERPSSKSPRGRIVRVKSSEESPRGNSDRTSEEAPTNKAHSIGRSHNKPKDRPPLKTESATAQTIFTKQLQDALSSGREHKSAYRELMEERDGERGDDDELPVPLPTDAAARPAQLPPLMIPTTKSEAAAIPKLPPPLIGPGSAQGIGGGMYSPPVGAVPVFGWGTTIVPRQVTAPEMPPTAPPFVAPSPETTTTSDPSSLLVQAETALSASAEALNSKVSDEGDIAFEEMMIDGRLCNVIVTGPITKLIDVMAAREIPDQHYIDAFILTHTYFMKSSVLISKLSAVFSRVPDESASEAEKEEHRKWQKAIRGRVVNVILRWIERKFEDMATYPRLITQVLNFITQKVLEDPSDRMMTVLATKLGKAIHRQRQEYQISLSDLDTLRLQQCSGIEVSSEMPPRTNSFTPVSGASSGRIDRAHTVTSPHLIPSASAPMTSVEAADAHSLSRPGALDTKVGKSSARSKRNKYLTTKRGKTQVYSSVSDLKPIELAQQITMLEQTMFRSVFPSEILCGNWKRDNKDEVSPNVLQLIRWFNHITLWVATECVQPEKPKHRAKVIVLFIQAALELRKMQNYNSCIELVMGLQTPTVKCMKKVWAIVEKTNPSELENFRDLERITDYEGNYKDYRLEFKSKLPPRLPYLAVHLGDLLTMEELPTYIKSTKHINYKKMRLIYEAAQPLLVKNDLAYEFTVNDHIQKFFFEDLVVLTEKESYKRAKSLESAK